MVIIFWSCQEDVFLEIIPTQTISEENEITHLTYNELLQENVFSVVNQLESNLQTTRGIYNETFRMVLDTNCYCENRK